MRTAATTLALGAVIVLTGCGGASTAGTSTADAATHTGWLRDRQPNGTIVLDPAVLLSGEEAVEAARVDGQLPPDGTLPNDFYVDDDEATTIRFGVADDVKVALYDCTSHCELQPVSAAAFLDGRVQPHGGPNALVSLLVRDGDVVRVAELYLP